MSNGFTLNQEELLDRLTTATAIHDTRGQATFYAVVCTNDEGQSSHGGFITADLPQAMRVALESNEEAPEGHACKYIPVALGISLETFAAVLQDLQGPNAPYGGEDA
jgi:hypothetical protein